MKIAALLLVSAAVVGFAQDQKSADPPAQEMKKLASVTWDLKTHKLMWVVQNGFVKQGEFQITSSEKYEISPSDATMVVADQKRGFSDNEAVALQQLLNTLSIYCAESVIWWDHGEGEKLDGNSPQREKVQRPTPTPKAPAATPIAWKGTPK